MMQRVYVGRDCDDSIDTSQWLPMPDFNERPPCGAYSSDQSDFSLFSRLGVPSKACELVKAPTPAIHIIIHSASLPSTTTVPCNALAKSHSGILSRAIRHVSLKKSSEVAMSPSPESSRAAAPTVRLILLSFAFFPVGITVLFCSFIAQALFHQEKTRRLHQRRPGFKSRTVLISGIGTSSGLALARTLYQAGHNVIGADFQHDILPPNRFSRAVKTFYPLPQPVKRHGSSFYAQELIRIMGRESVDIWISCSSNVIQDAETRRMIECSASRKCKNLQYDAETAALLSKRASFMEMLRSCDLPTPEAHRVSTRAAVHRILNGSPGPKKSYTMRKSLDGEAGPINLTVLPRRTLSQTYQHVSQVPVSGETPFLLEEVVVGDRYQTQALIVQDEVRGFVACSIQGKGANAGVVALANDSIISQAMLRYQTQLVSRLSRNLSGFLGLSFTVTERITEKGFEKLLYATESHLHPDGVGLALYRAGIGLADRLVGTLAPMQVNGVDPREKHDSKVLYAQPGSQTYWIGRDVVMMILEPTYAFLRLKIGLQSLLRSYLEFADRLAFWQDATFEWWDPLPWWWAYQVYWPTRFLRSFLEGRTFGQVDLDLLTLR